jgi:FixJ family two-component response regulator
MQQQQEPTVFIIDDDEAVRDSLEMLMHSVGQKVKVFASAREFLEIYDENHPGCIALDIRMPGMTKVDISGNHLIRFTLDNMMQYFAFTLC